MARQLERDIEAAMIEYLRSRGALAQKIRSTGRFIRGRLIPLPIDERGVADILGCYRGKFFAIEVKSPKGRQTDYQKSFQARVIKSGGLYIVARSVSDLGVIFAEAA